MIKKRILFVLALTLLLTLCACDNNDEPSGSGSETTDAQQVSSDESGNEASSDPASDEATSYEITDCRAKTWTSSTGSFWVQTIVEITNTGTTNLYLSSGAYDLEDASGNLVASQTMVSAYPDVLAPGEKGYMYEETILDAAVDGDLTVLPREEVEEATIDLVRFPVTDVSISTDNYGDLKMIGRVENDSGEAEDSMVYIVAFLYDTDGTCIGQMFTILTEDLASGDKIGFELSSISLPDDVTADAVADYVVYAYPLQYQF